MQRFYTFFVAVMLAVAGFAQKTVTFVFEHPEHIASVGGYWDTYTIDDDGKCTIPDGTYSFIIRATNVAKITDVLVDDQSKFTASAPQSSVSVYYSDIVDGSIIKVMSQENPVTTIRIKANPEHVYLTKDNQSFDGVENVDGEWVIEDHELATYGVSVYEGFQITGVESNIETELGTVTKTYWNMPWSYTAETEHIYTVSTAALADLRTKKLTVNVTGDSEKVQLYRYDSYTAIPLVEGENTVMFQESESPFTIEPKYGTSLYSVKYNGEPVEDTGSYGSKYVIPAVDGDVVDVEADFPDLDVPVKFTFVNEGTEGTVAYVRLNDKENLDPEVYLADDFSVKYGDKLFVSFNSGDYDIESVTLNDEPYTNLYGSSFFATELDGYEFVINATVKPSYQITVHCAQWEHIKYTEGWNAENMIPLTAETSVITISPSTYSVNFYAFDDYDIESIEGTEAVLNEYSPTQLSLYSVTPEDEIEVTINTVYTERSQAAVFYLQPITAEDKEAGQEYWSHDIRLNYMNRNMYKDITLEEGYNTIKFADSDNPIALYISPTPSAVYVNGELAEPTNEWSTVASEVEIENGDVVKIMHYENVANYNVVYAIDENAAVKVFHDQMIEVAEPATHSLMEGTEVRIVFNEIPETETNYYEHQLKVNDEEVAIEDGEYKFNVAADTNIEVKVLEFTGVENVAASNKVPADVYNLQGVRILNNATADQIKALPAGIYVIGGQKRVIR